MNEMTRLYREGMHELREENEALKTRNVELETILNKFVEAGTELYHNTKAEWYAGAAARADWKELMRTYKKDWVI